MKSIFWYRCSIFQLKRAYKADYQYKNYRKTCNAKQHPSRCNTKFLGSHTVCVCVCVCVCVTVYEITDEALSGLAASRPVGVGDRVSLVIKRKRRGLVWGVMSSNPVTHLYVFIQSFFCSCHTLTRRHQTLPSLLHHSTLVSLYLNSSPTCLVYFVSVNYRLPSSREVVQCSCSAGCVYCNYRSRFWRKQARI